LNFSKSGHSFDEAGREGDDSPDELQDASYRNPDDPEWKQQQPHQGIKYERDKRQWPAQNEQNAPEQKFNHDDPRIRERESTLQGSPVMKPACRH
jgi:hypothetical protein